jgi:hypothetical protein
MRGKERLLEIIPPHDSAFLDFDRWDCQVQWISPETTKGIIHLG